MNVVAERLVQIAQQLLIDSKWDDAIVVLKQAEKELPDFSLDISACFLREKVGTLLSQAYERTGQLADALNASNMIYLGCLKSRALLLLRMNQPKEAAPIFEELATLDKSWVDQVQAEQRKMTPRAPSLLDLGPAALDRLLLLMEGFGLFRAKCVSTKLFRTCKAMKDLAAKFIDVKVTVDEGQQISFDGMLKCGSLSIEVNFEEPIRSFHYGQIEARHLSLRGIIFPTNSEILRFKGVSSLHMFVCENVRLDLTGIEELLVFKSEFTFVTGSLKSLRKLEVSDMESTDPLILHLQAERLKLEELEADFHLFPSLQRQLVTLKSLSFEMHWKSLRPLIMNPEMWKTIRDLHIVLRDLDRRLWTILMSNLVNCQGLIVDNYSDFIDLPSIWPPKLAYLKLEGAIRIGKSPNGQTKSVPKGQVVQPRCVHIRGDEVFGLKLSESVKYLILENFSRKLHGILPKDARNLQVIVTGNKGLTPENMALIPPGNITSGLVKKKTVEEYFQWWRSDGYRELVYYPPWGLPKRN